MLENTIIRRTEVPKILGISLAQFDRIRSAKDTDFPPAVRLGPQSVGYRVKDIEAWIERRTQVH